MTIEWLRDLIIIISGIVFIGLTILIAVIVFSLNKKIQIILSKTEAIAETIRSITQKISKPVVIGSAIAEFIFQIINNFNAFFKHAGGKKNEQ